MDKQPPLALKARPISLDEFVGQKHILGEGKLLRRVILSERMSSFIFYGPPGVGKTTLGFIIAHRIGGEFKYLNAAFSSVGEVKEILKEAAIRLEKEKKRTVLFIDEIHRFNKLQQEALVPDTEAGKIIFIGATIYNPYYYLINSLISRSIIAKFKPLSKEEILEIINRILKDKHRGLGNLNLKVEPQALDYIATHCAGDARKAITALEIGALTTPVNERKEIVLTEDIAKNSIQQDLFYDREDNYHYDTISAFIKSVRGSSPDSAIYWLARMLASGEDPRFIARRLVILASEDIGNAQPLALVLATSCFQAVEFVGRPEADIILAQVTLYLACSPKSNASYMALKRAKDDIDKGVIKEVPMHLKTHSRSYKYPHNFSVDEAKIGSYVAQDYGIKKRYYLPRNSGEEKKIKEFLNILERIKNVNRLS